MALRQDASTGEVKDDGKALEESGSQAANGRPTMSIKVYAPFKVYFEGEAESLTAANETGPFDILPKHHNFLCMLVPCDLIIKIGDEVRTVKIARALMHVKAEKVTVFVDV
jgi:F0F1-type ATP synthase epsilon subunit